MLSQAIPVEEIVNDYIKLVLYGQNRTGKTTLACQFPKPLLIISYEPGTAGGANSIKKIPGIKYLRITSSAMALMLAKELESNNICDLPGYSGQPYQTHVHDTMTSLQDIVLQELLGLDAAPVQLNYGTVSRDTYRERSEKTREVLRPFRDLPVHTVFIAQEKDHNPPKDTVSKLLRGSQLESFFAADLGGATVKWVHDACDYIGRLYIDKEIKLVSTDMKGKDGKIIKGIPREVETGKLVRRLRTMYHTNFAAGFRSPTPENIPEFIEAVSPKEMCDKILELIRGGSV